MPERSPERSEEELLALLASTNPFPPELARRPVSPAAAESLLAPVLLGELRGPLRVVLSHSLARPLRRAPRRRDERPVEAVLAARNPVPDADLAATPWTGRRDALFDAIVGGEVRSRAVRLRHRRTLAAVAALLCLLGAGAGYALASRPVRTGLVVRCFSSANPQGHSTDVVASGQSAAQTCAEDAWVAGAFGSRRPHLVTCLSPAGVPWVFPGAGGGVCASLGLSEALSPRGVASAEATLQRALSELSHDKACLTSSEMTRDVRAELARLGLGGWKVTEPAPTAAADPCAIPDVEPDHVVALIPTPVPPPARAKAG